jgi:hypothetical protein
VAQRPLWRCPRCGKSYVTRNLWHSCVVVTLADHFGDRPRSEELYRAVLAMLEREGPVTVSVSRTRIEFMTRARYAGVQVRRDWLRLGFWLKRRVDSDRFLRAEHLGRRDWIYQLAIRDESDLDDELASWLREARTVGDQMA